MKRCKKCYTRNDLDSVYCINCGDYLLDTIECPNCRQPMQKNEKECPYCQTDNPHFDSFESSAVGKAYHVYNSVNTAFMIVGIIGAFIGLMILIVLIVLLSQGWQ